MQPYKQLAQLLHRLHAAAPGLDTKNLIAINPPHHDPQAASSSSSNLRGPALPAWVLASSGNAMIPASEAALPSLAAGHSSQAAATELKKHVNVDNVTQLAGIVDELLLVASDLNPDSASRGLCASHVYMLELCSAMQPFLESPPITRSAAEVQTRSGADDVYEERVEHWSAMDSPEISAAVAYLCFGPEALPALPRDFDCPGSLLSGLCNQQGASGLEQPPSSSLFKPNQNETQHAAQAAHGSNAAYSASSAGDSHIDARSPLNLTLKAGIARDAIAVLRFQADGGTHTDSAASMQSLNWLEGMCQGLLAADDFCSTEQLSTRHASTVEHHLARPNLPTSPTAMATDAITPASSRLDLFIGDRGGDADRSVGISKRHATQDVHSGSSHLSGGGTVSSSSSPDPCAEQDVNSGSSQLGGRSDDPRGVAAAPQRSSSQDVGLQEENGSQRLCRAPQLLACVQELAATGCPASLLQHLITSCISRGLPLPPASLAVHQPQSTATLLGSLAQGSQPQFEHEDDAVGAFLVDALRDLAQGQISKLAPGPDVWKESGRRARASSNARFPKDALPALGQAGGEPLQAIYSLLGCLADANDSGHPSGSISDPLPHPRHAWLEHARNAVWDVLLSSALDAVPQSADGVHCATDESAPSAHGLPHPHPQNTSQHQQQPVAAAAEAHEHAAISHGRCKPRLAPQPRAVLLQLLHQLQSSSTDQGTASRKQASPSQPATGLCWAGWQPPSAASDVAEHASISPSTEVAFMQLQLLMARTIAALQPSWAETDESSAEGPHSVNDGVNDMLCSAEDLASLSAAAVAFNNLLRQAAGQHARLRALSHLLSDVWDHGHVFVSTLRSAPSS